MQDKGLQPTLSTFTSILTGCSHSGLVDDGLSHFHLMQYKYSITPAIEHLNCVVDLLGRANKLKEAEEFISENILYPNEVTWRTLLGACRTHNNVQLAKTAMEKILQINPNDAPTYVMMANIHAADNQHSAAQQIRATMQNRGIKKIPGTSTIEINGVVHTFFVDDTRHPGTKAIHAEIEKMKAEARHAGYLPNLCFVLHDVEEELKKDLLWYHSEKLAIAYGMLHVASPSPIVVHKNLRVCGDCHEATKLISKLRGRKIFVRDASRWHHFIDGKCSCGDYF